MCRISKIITFLESLRQAGWFDLFESDIQALVIFDPLITLWGNFDAPYLKLLNDASVASACFYVRTCRRVRNSKKIATIRDFHLPGSFLCLSTRLVPYLGIIQNWILHWWNVSSKVSKFSLPLFFKVFPLSPLGRHSYSLSFSLFFCICFFFFPLLSLSFFFRRGGR